MLTNLTQISQNEALRKTNPVGLATFKRNVGPRDTRHFPQGQAHRRHPVRI